MMIIQCASLATWTFEGRSWNRNLASDCSLLTIYSHTCPNISYWTNIFCNLDKYILRFGQIHSAICTNKSCNFLWSWNRNLASDCSLLTIYSHTCPNISSTLDKYILWFGQIHLVIWTNTSWGPTGAQTSSYTYIWWEEVFFFCARMKKKKLGDCSFSFPSHITNITHIIETLQILLTSLKHYKHNKLTYIACFLDALASLRRGVSWPRDSQPTQKAKK